MGISRSPAYQKIMNTKGNNRDSLSFPTTFHAYTAIIQLALTRKSFERKEMPREEYNPFRGVDGCAKLWKF